MKNGWISLFCVGCLLVVSQAFAADQMVLEITVANVPLYDNVSSEARAFNRTVTILLEYMAGE